MHIGIDVRNLTGGSVTGIARVLIESARVLDERGARLSFFWPGRRQASPLDTFTTARHVESVFPQAGGAVAWQFTGLPLAARRARPDVFWGPAHRLPAFMPRTIPLVVTIHDLVWHRQPQTMTLRRRLADAGLMRLAVLRADKVLADSDATARDIGAILGRQDAETLYPGVTQMTGTPRADVLARHGLARGGYALFVGTVEPRKNLVRLLDAFTRSRAAARADWTLALAGGQGWKDEAIRARLAPLISAGHVRVLGYVSDSDLAALYAHARFLAMPSLYEGFGLPVIEAQQHGTPVLVSTAGSLPEIAGAGGLAVDPFDEQQLGLALARLFSDDTLRAGLSSAAHANARRFDWQAYGDRLTAIFETLARTHPR
ncbi:Glycosyl transferase group 1 [Devosia sp. LC5]|uniref:glycosyltransferase family 4 protein n=1 Tax=Devosia sp. LC5 TaxID=1502724 RepID=UPI0004E3D612|nr:glycosyltransferase family 1 protein [Devosia sp. LC5]KFC64553.1 Glycosyl transferase group 1 [Devosia sp. LC5]